MEEFIGLMAVILIFGTPILIVFLIVRARHREKIALIKSGHYDQISIVKPPSTGNAALAWGMIFIALGLAGVTCSSMSGIGDDPEDIFWSLAVFLCGGALILYWRITAPIRKKAMELFELQIEEMREARAEERMLDNYEIDAKGVSEEGSNRE